MSIRHLIQTTNRLVVDFSGILISVINLRFDIWNVNMMNTHQISTNLNLSKMYLELLTDSSLRKNDEDKLELNLSC